MARPPKPTRAIRDGKHWVWSDKQNKWITVWDKAAPERRAEGKGAGSGKSAGEKRRVADSPSLKNKKGKRGTPGEGGVPAPDGDPSSGGTSGSGKAIGDVGQTGLGYHFVGDTETPLNFGMGVVTPSGARTVINANIEGVDAFKARRDAARAAVEAAKPGTQEYKDAKAALREATLAHQEKMQNAAGVVTNADAYANVPARYLEGDDTLILAELSTGNVPDASLEDVQAQMVALGKMSKGRGKSLGYTPGVLDQKTTEAFKKLLGEANASGQSWKDLLFSDFAFAAADANSSGSDSSGGGSGGGGGGSGALYDPEDIRQAVDKSGQEQAGRNIDPVAREQIVAQVMAEAQAADAAGQPYDIAAEIARRTKERTPGDVAQHNVFNVFDNFAKHLGAGQLLGSGGAGAGLTPVATGAQSGVQ